MDLQKRNKINSKKYGTRGEVTEQLAAILKALWACHYTPDMSTAFKVHITNFILYSVYVIVYLYSVYITYTINNK